MNLIAGGSSAIYFYKLPQSFPWSSAAFFIKVDDKEGIILIENLGWFCYETTPGTHDVYSRQMEGGIVYSRPYIHNITVHLKPGEACYLRYKAKAGIASEDRVIVEEVPSEVAIKEMAGLKKFMRRQGSGRTPLTTPY